MSALTEAEVASLRARLGLESVTPDRAGLHDFYRAWCLAVPFDNLRKMKAMFRAPEGPLPALSAAGFVGDWLDHGVGGTCWPHAEALHGVLTALGFDARRATGSMFDFGDPNHATTLVRLADGSTWLLDNALLSMVPLRIDPEAPTLHGDPVHFAEVEIDGDQVFVHGTHPPMPHIFFRLMARDVPSAEYRERWVAARSAGPFNERVHIRRNTPEAIRVLRGGMFVTRDAAGVRVETVDRAGLLERLVRVMGVSPSFVGTWAASGALESSLTPPGPPPDLPVRTPPSRR
ncbi:MAG: arylamine N-acetyltransferase [Fimbriimonadaceae bacterium]